MNNNMINFDEYIRQGEPQQREKGYAWQTAIGLQAVDGLKPSDYLIETARKDIEGEITIDEAEQLIKSYYQSKQARTPEDDGMHEADTASTNIRRLLTEKTFAFTLVGLTSIHRRIFDGVFKFAGQIRDYNITKKEWARTAQTGNLRGRPQRRGTGNRTDRRAYRRPAVGRRHPSPPRRRVRSRARSSPPALIRS